MPSLLYLHQSPEEVDIHYVCPISEVNGPPQKILRMGGFILTSAACDEEDGSQRAPGMCGSPCGSPEGYI